MQPMMVPLSRGNSNTINATNPNMFRVNIQKLGSPQSQSRGRSVPSTKNGSTIPTVSIPMPSERRLNHPSALGDSNHTTIPNKAPGAASQVITSGGTMIAHVNVGDTIKASVAGSYGPNEQEL